MVGQRKRIEIALTDAVAKRLDWLKENTQAKNLTEVVKDALELKEAVTKLQLAGETVLVRDASGLLRELFHPEKETPV